MSTRSTVHANFSIERDYPYPPARVFHAFADEGAKASWFADSPAEMSTDRLEFDFRVGGLERLAMQVKDGPSITYDARYEDIVTNERIVSSYIMTMDGERISVSVATTEFVATDAGTRLILTEQGAFLDGLDNNAQREQGTRELLQSLGQALEDGLNDDA